VRPKVIVAVVLARTDSYDSVIHCIRKKRTCNLPWITLTNLNVFLLFLAHIIPMIRTC